MVTYLRVQHPQAVQDKGILLVVLAEGHATGLHRLFVDWQSRGVVPDLSVRQSQVVQAGNGPIARQSSPWQVRTIAIAW